MQEDYNRGRHAIGITGMVSAYCEIILDHQTRFSIRLPFMLSIVSKHIHA